ncbi:MAG: aldehyde dehydrogenase family protein [candidate division Zixibacteria bacterium]|nr:aldehyde dehydrogenase family protein [candidate division Zixibacteria bacterium]
MSPLQETDISEIVQKVLNELNTEQPTATPPAQPTTTQSSGSTMRGVFSSVDDAVDAARRAHKTFLDLGLAKRYEIVHRMREVAIANAELWGRMAVEETGLGKMPDKMNKILLAARKTPGPEDVKPESFSGDHGLTLVESAPYGVVGVITPSTNPASTVVNNAISLLSAGNACVFNPHPAAKNVCREIAVALGTAVRAAGGPENLISVIAEPTQSTGQGLMKHTGIDLLLVTGGGVVVKLAMTSGNRAICAGPGNPPVVVDETAVITKAGRDIVCGAGFDNNILCTDEKSIFVVDKVANPLKREMISAGAFEITGTNIDKLMQAVITEDKVGKGHRHVSVNKSFIGKDLATILQQVDIKPPSGAQIAIVEATWDHPLVMAEQMMPIIPFVRCRSVDEAMEWAVISEHKFEHTFLMHSTSVANLSAMAQRCNGNIFVKNGPNMAGLGYGGEGYATLSIAGTTGEGMTKASTFTRPRRCTLVDYFRIV